MARTIKVDPLTRIEGHASVEIDIDDNNQVTSSIFKVMDFRGWETFMQGTQIEMMPLIMPRICGTCSVSHHLASAKTVDNIFGVTPPPAAVLLRQAMNLAGYIHSHGIHIFALAGPDLLLGVDAESAKRNIVGLIDTNPELAKRALRLRAISTYITEILGGRGIHPVSAVAGGVASPLSETQRDSLKPKAEEAVTLAQALLEEFKQVLFPQKNLLQSLELPTHYMGLVNTDGSLDFYQGNLRLRGIDNSYFEFPEEQWENYLFEKTDPHSYAKFVFCQTQDGKEVPYRVGPLARLNCCDQIDTPLANTELQALREMGGFPCHQTVLYHYARLIEMLYATEKLVELFNNDEICSKDVRTQPTGNFQNGQRGIGIIEAPRGVLIHDYKVDESGIVNDINLIVATQQNIKAINDTIAMSAQKYLNQPDDNLLLNGIEFGVRCYDPCLSCATHRIGDMKLDVVIRRQGEVIRTAKR
ncbi:nickel-dependent methyl viologen-reducing hydrogenase, large subunit [Candidatus Thiomargarita nelsonii]|uniref:Nickel-dependent methyl viologen-reducing hydrogenase, large subunit n=1 Tax=Candidatus Thiomargarita nelsonii TaxID=1003181 RepID=A0A0A6RKZ6_9GAMM|nr:nickel-dependent methyl viologen-reducing hydrogenase, large subunit [Candidatus Thiomargarita nelsonii]